MTSSSSSSSSSSGGGRLRYDNRVVVVTGAGAGLGKQYALYFGARGAKVVVNDLGGGMHGGGGDSRPAELVAQQIVAAGGQAVADFHSVEDGEAVVRSALDNFGRVDVVVNNAGILRDRSLANISDEDWDLVHRVHLRGSFLVTRAAWPHMRRQRYGRVLMTASAAGIYGNFGQANYSSAKLGLLGLSNTLALEGAKYNIRCNTIAPIAGSRLTESVMPPDLVRQLRPEFVAPLVLFLCHEACEETGQIFEVGAGWIGKLRWERTRGAIVHRTDAQLTPEAVQEAWPAVCDFDSADRPRSIEESTGNFVDVLQQLQRAPAEPPKSLAEAVGYESEPSCVQYDSRDVILYALGVGASTSEPDHLRFLFEGSEDFSALPTFGVVPAFRSTLGFVTNELGSLVDPTRILHGEQYTELLRPLPTSGRLVTSFKLVDVVDKRRGALLILDAVSRDAETQEAMCYNQFVVYAGGAGGFGGRGSSQLQKQLVPVPERPPDRVVEQRTSADQAALYRLSGDRNPLHIDPAFAALGGQSRPILHGLCTLGYAGRHVLREFCANRPGRFRAMKVRFTSPLLPGHTVVTEMWREAQRVFVRCRAKETGDVCLSGHVDVAEEEGEGQQEAAARQIFTEIQSRVAANPQLADGADAVFLWTVATPGGQLLWTFDLRSRPPQLHEGKPSAGRADCELQLDEDTLVAMVTGKVNPQKAFMSGQLKLKGNIMLSQKLEKILKDAAKL